MKYSVKKGPERLVLKQFKDSLDSQINNNLIAALKEEEWLLESVGLSTLRNNNLLPTIEQPVMAKNVLEAFLRFDDKPMITGSDAISKSLQRFCMNGEYCIASGDGINFTKYFFQETVPFFEITESTYWLVDKSLKPQPNATHSTDGTAMAPTTVVNDSDSVSHPEVKAEASDMKKFNSITISGKVPLESYTELFNCFISPFMKSNRIEIEMKFKIKSTAGGPLDESKPQYKSAKEAAKQLGLNFEEE